MDRPDPQEALAQVLRDHGRLVGLQPDRVRGLLSDLLGVGGRDFRAEVDALVVACEEGIPALLLDTVDSADTAVTEGVGLLEARGLTTERAAGATLAWASALEAPVSESLSSSMRSDPSAPSSGGDLLSAAATSLPAPTHRTPTVEPVPTRPSHPSKGPEPDREPRTNPAQGPARFPFARGRTAGVAAGLVAVIVAGTVGATILWPDGPSKADTRPVAAQGGTLRLTTSGGLTWDPMETTDPGLRLLMNRALYRGLVAFAAAADDEPGTLVADLATTTGQTVDKGRTWVFALRPDAHWEDGSPVTCADAKAGVARAFGAARFFGYSYEAAILIDVPHTSDGLPVYKGAGTAGRAAFDSAVRCSGSDLTIRLLGPEYEFPRYLALPELAPYRAAAPLGPGKRSMSSGPYVVEASAADAATLVRNAHWSRQADSLRPAVPDRLSITTTDVDDVASGLATDAVEFRRSVTLSPLPASADKAFAQSPDRTQVAPAGVTEMLVPNLRTTTMSSTAYRRAFALSTDRLSYVAAMGGPAVSMVQRSTAGTYHSSPSVAFDVAQARSLLAGDKPRLKVAFHASPESERAMTALAAGWRQAGFKVDLVAFRGSRAAYVEAIATAAGTTTYDAVRTDYVDSLNRSATAQLVDPRFAVGPSAAEAKTVTTAIDRAIGTPPGPDRDAAWRSVDDVIAVLSLLVPLANRASLVGSGSAVRGATTSIEFSGVLDPLRISLAPAES
ncbi:ABC-type transport system, substrate-binding protein [Pedococcus dokdonensis]|uniref:ABC-type transport system, substrate-binding protein n=1 Tax=Pedococcus dokdonensis TaxID=443156 RepID=A0A1H0S9A0_9MICO|nr:ABC transporter substrate-binding protein [Pedococcus dokdonensis]SDP38334.1 ABC-type transport system, substrate-binding protein [Pedococcus dokdonensis]